MRRLLGFLLLLSLVCMARGQAAYSYRYWYDNDETTVQISSALNGQINLDISHLSVGVHSIHCQIIDASGEASSVRTQYFYMNELQLATLTCKIWIDDDEEGALDFPLTDEDIEIDAEDLSYGSHDLHVALFDSEGVWLAESSTNFEVPIPTETITITSAGQATYCSAHDLDFSSVRGMKAYIASGYIKKSGTVILLRVTDVPAYEGLMLIGAPGTYEVPYTNSTAYYANMLKGNVEPVDVDPTDGEYINYYLSNGSNGLGFYNVSSTRTMSAHRAILQLPNSLFSNAPAMLNIKFEDEATNINEKLTISTEDSNRIYDLQGRQIEQPKKGVYIKNGKKLVIK